MPQSLVGLKPDVGVTPGPALPWGVGPTLAFYGLEGAGRFTASVKGGRGTPPSGSAGTPAWDTDLSGPVLSLGGTSDVQFARPNAAGPANAGSAVSVFARFNYNSISANGSVIWHSGEFADSNNAVTLGVSTNNKLSWDNNGFNFGINIESGLTVSAGRWWCGGVVQTTSTSRVFFLGGLTESNTTDNGTGTVTNTNPYILGRGYSNGGATTSGWNGLLDVVYVWDYAVPLQVMLDLCADPYLPFRRPLRTIRRSGLVGPPPPVATTWLLVA